MAASADGRYRLLKADVKGFTQIYNPDLPLGFPKSSGTISSKVTKSSLFAWTGASRTLSVGLGPTALKPLKFKV